jgi:ribose transport system ATP-binding protein
MTGGGLAPETDHPADRRPVLEMTGIRKSFGGVHALRGIDFSVRPGEIHALLGENGAGKSTLMNIMCGALSDYHGQMRLEGQVVRFSSPHAAQKAGVATVFQELDLVPGLPVADNLSLGREPTRRLLFLDGRRMRRTAERALAVVGASIAARTTVSALRLGEQQIVAIAKALTADARILILDEPTAALSAHEVELLFDLMRGLRESGVGIVFISHRLDEVAKVADRVTVMRDGRVVAVLPGSTTPEELVPLLTGRPARDMFPARTTVRDRVCLRTNDFGYRLRRPSASWREPTGVSLTVREGEIVGLVGLLGSGRTELLQAICGAAPPGRTLGTVEINGRTVRLNSIISGQRQGIGFVPDDRRRDGLVPTRDVAQNLALSSLSRLSTAGFVRRGRQREAVRWAFEAFGIKASTPAAPILSLSGGNQQKVLIGRALLREPHLLLLDEPTRGVDVAAKADIYRLVRSLAAQGLAVLVASSELPELAGWCDRLVVLRDGRVVVDVAPDTDPALVLASAGGATPPDTSPQERP